MSLRLLIVDDHEVVRIGLRTLLARVPDFEIVDEASTAHAAIAKTLQHRPDVVLLDIRLPDQSGIQACRAIVAQSPQTRVVMLTSYAEDDMLFDAIAAGASGYVLKQIGSDALIEALRAVGRGESLVDPALMSKVLARVRDLARRDDANAFAKLNEQEMKILAHVAEGKTNHEIAALVFLSEKTVRNYVSNILAKLGLSTRAQAATYATTHRLHDFMHAE